jgi:hypothetical protein
MINLWELGFAYSPLCYIVTIPNASFPHALKHHLQENSDVSI